jgi:hypothetical protein
VIAVVGDNLKREGIYSVEKHIESARTELKDRDTRKKK